METKKYDVRVVAAVEQLSEQRRQLELSAAEAKARLSHLKDRLSKVAHEDATRIHELKTAIEVQQATNEALAEDIEVRERQTFGNRAAAVAAVHTLPTPLQPQQQQHPHSLSPAAAAAAAPTGAQKQRQRQQKHRSEWPEL